MEVTELSITERVHRVRFNKIIYRRYPQSKHLSLRQYFRCGPGDRITHGTGYLHRDMWRFHYGEIPDDHDVDHIDGNPLNNTIANLQLLTVQEHQAKHLEESVARFRKWRQENPERHREILRSALAWHSTPEGLAWHSEHARRVFGDQPFVTLACQQCGSDYQTRKSMRDQSRFCSNNCKSAARRATKADHVERICVACGKPFMANKYLHTKNCSLSCGRRSQNRARKAGV